MIGDVSRLKSTLFRVRNLLKAPLWRFFGYSRLASRGEITAIARLVKYRLAGEPRPIAVDGVRAVLVDVLRVHHHEELPEGIIAAWAHWLADGMNKQRTDDVPHYSRVAAHSVVDVDGIRGADR